MGAVIIILGIITFIGKFHILFSDWKRMTGEEKQKIKIKPLCRNLGVMIALCGVIVLVGGLSNFFLEKMFAYFILSWFVLAAVDAWWISKSSRYKNK